MFIKVASVFLHDSQADELQGITTAKCLVLRHHCGGVGEGSCGERPILV